MTMSAAYLDWNATAPLRASARDAMTAALDLTGNPSSVHRFGRDARRLVEAARDRVKALVGAGDAGIVFTSGATEANLMALGGIARPVIRSAVEHVSVAAARVEATVCPVDADGAIDLAALDAQLRSAGAPALVSVMAANNETGVLQPIAAVAELVHRHAGILHCDAVQMAGRLAIDMPALGIDLLSVSSHKLGGPQGVGALVVAPGIELRPVARGGGQERGLRPGTENVAGIAGFGAACTAAVAEPGCAADVAAMRDRLEREARARAPHTIVVASGAARLPNTTALALPGADASTIVMALDLEGVAVSAGAACSSGKVQPSHVLTAMQVPAAVRQGTIRVSLGPTTVAVEIDRFLDAWARIAARLDGGSRAAA
ncbi:MAG: cysteine desulfurase [Alphaproteobacteria bacterium]|nr:cysteine desulfurase [Alphaproteobacteria bacterium]